MRSYSITMTIDKGMMEFFKTKIDLLPFFKQVERLLTAGKESVFGKNFEQGGRPDMWKRTKDMSRVPGERVSSLGRKTLVKSGALRSSLTKGARGNLTRIDKTGIYINSALPYAHVHNEGGHIPERRPVNSSVLRWYSKGKPVFSMRAKGFQMPKREFAVIPDSDFPIIENSATLFLNGLMKKTGGRVTING